MRAFAWKVCQDICILLFVNNLWCQYTSLAHKMNCVKSLALWKCARNEAMLPRACPRCTKKMKMKKKNGHMIKCFLTEWGLAGQPRRRRQRERRQTKGLMSKTMAVHVRYDSLYISLPSSAKQQREMTEFFVVFGKRRTAAIFSYLHLE